MMQNDCVVDLIAGRVPVERNGVHFFLAVVLFYRNAMVIAVGDDVARRDRQGQDNPSFICKWLCVNNAIVTVAGKQKMLNGHVVPPADQ